MSEAPGSGDVVPVRFVVVSAARSGSTLLRTYLDGHPQLCCHGELLGFRRILGLSMKGLPSWPGRHSQDLALELLPLRSRDPVGFLRRVLDDSVDLAVGFKALYQHLDDPQFAEVLDWLIDCTELRVIHLQRRNGLRRYVSYERHRRNRRDPASTGQPLTIDPVAARQDLGEVERRRARIDRELAAHPALAVAYEDLLADTVAQRRRILSFLGVGDEELAFRTEPSAEKLRDTIANYDEIRADPVLGPMLDRP